MCQKKRFNAEAVTCQDEALVRLVVKRKGKHPVQGLQELFAVSHIRVQDDLRVGLRAEAMARLLEVSAQLDEIVDFPVGNQNQFAVAGEQRLIAAAQIDDRQPRVGHSERSVDVAVGMVRAAVGERSYRRVKFSRVD